MNELTDKRGLPEREPVQQGEQGIKQPDSGDDGPTRWSGDEGLEAKQSEQQTGQPESGPKGSTDKKPEAVSDLSPQMEGQDASDTRTFDWYMERIKELDVSTGRDQAVFYSGRDPVIADIANTDHRDVRNYEIAKHYAAETGRMTLEMTPGGQWLEKQEMYKNPNINDRADEIWASLSQRFAEGASGEVVAFSRLLAPDPIWKIEKELLEQNPNVTKIDEV